MRSAWGFFVSVVLLLFERVRGPRYINEIKQPDQALGCLKGFSVRGYEIAIYCHRKSYRVHYKHWYVPDRSFFTYNVFSVISNDAPIALRKACELDVELPALIPRNNFDEEIRRRQVLAYLDLLEQRLLDFDPVPAWT
jgi:hypothetical protein